MRRKREKRPFTPPPELQHFFDTKEALLERKKELVNKRRDIDATLSLRFIIIILLFGLIAFIIAQFFPDYDWLLLPLLLVPILLLIPIPFFKRIGAVNDIKKLRSEFKRLGIEYKAAYKDFFIRYSSNTTDPNHIIGDPHYHTAEGDQCDWNGTASNWDDGDGTWDGDGGFDGDDGWGDGDGGWDSGGGDGDGGGDGGDCDGDGD